MSTTLSVIISLVSLAIATGMTVLLARMRREELRRADARVATLNQMAETDFLSEPEPGFASATSEESPAALFGTAALTSPWTMRLAVAGGMVVVVGLVAVMALHRAPAVDAGQRGVTQAAVAAPLELTALTHQQQGAEITVSGRVRNPRRAEAVSNLTATVFLFGADGAFMTSGRSPLDTSTLAAGGGSAFVVAIPVNGVVARYRVSFRDSAGHAVAHVDRRTGSSLARNE